MKNIPYGRQEITEADINSVVETLKSDFLTQGPKVQEFETSFSNFVGCKYAVAVSNGTAALHLSVLSLGLKKGEKVITTSITFAASANCVRYCDADVEFVDINPLNYLIDIELIRKKLLLGDGNYKGIICVDFGGLPCDLEALRSLANEFNLWIIEDACHAPGGFFIDSNGQSQLCGNGNYADLTVFSFHPVKHITSGEGGMVTTNNLDLYNKLMLLRSHGITKDKEYFVNSIETIGGIEAYPAWYMEMQELGFNYRLTDIQAALGISQLTRLNSSLEKRRKIARKYIEQFKDCSKIMGYQKYSSGNAYHLFIIEVDERLKLFNYLRELNIYCQIHYFPVHLMPYYKNLGITNSSLINAENYYSRCISLPMYPTLTNEEQDYVIESILNFFNEE